MACAACGCGGERAYPVKLDVKLADGKPAAGCSVILARKESPAITAGGRVGADGSCTPTVAGWKAAGLPAGTYRVAVSAEVGPPVDGPRKRPPFAGKYTNPEQSGLEVKVGPGQSADISLALDR